MVKEDVGKEVDRIGKKEESAKEENTQQVRKPRIPDFKGDGVACWLNTRENGTVYLNIKIVGHENVYAKKT